MTNFEILKLFPVPLIKFKFKYHKKYYFEDIEKSVNFPEDWEIPLNTSFPMIPDNDPVVDNVTKNHLMADIKFCVDEVFEELKLPTDYYLKNFWYNIYHNEQGQEDHAHLAHVNNIGTYWSGIYYNKNPTPTRFKRSDTLYETQLFPGYKDCNIKEAYYYVFSPDVEEGDIIVFPPYLRHSVPILDSESFKMRMTFSFNLVLKS